MKPIAVIHWTHYGKEHHADIYGQRTLRDSIETLKRCNVMFYVCMTSLKTPLPHVTCENDRTGDLKTM